MKNTIPTIAAFFAPLILGLASCSGGSDPFEPGKPDMIEWTNSANGSLVSDATGDMVEFRADNQKMYFGSSTYGNIWVDEAARLIVDGQRVGSVAYVRSTSNEIITALVANNGTLLDVYGPESNLTIRNTNRRPTLAGGFVIRGSWDPNAVPVDDGLPPAHVEGGIHAPDLRRVEPPRGAENEERLEVARMANDAEPR